MLDHVPGLTVWETAQTISQVPSMMKNHFCKGDDGGRDPRRDFWRIRTSKKPLNKTQSQKQFDSKTISERPKEESQKLEQGLPFRPL
jgi:hypothetical protein